MNNTEKLDDIRRRLRRIETRLGIVQRVSVIVFERVTGRGFPSSWVIHADERALLGDAEANDDEFRSQLAGQYAAPWGLGLSGDKRHE
jgi:hypothetical protein